MFGTNKAYPDVIVGDVTPPCQSIVMFVGCLNWLEYGAISALEDYLLCQNRFPIFSAMIATKCYKHVPCESTKKT